MFDAVPAATPKMTLVCFIQSCCMLKEARNCSHQDSTLHWSIDYQMSRVRPTHPACCNQSRWVLLCTGEPLMFVESTPCSPYSGQIEGTSI
eukprot:6196269-Pleurochrysis_carterae.AAC.2